MTKYEVWHKIVNEFYFGEIVAKDRDDAENKAMDMLPKNRKDYDECDEFIVEEVVKKSKGARK